MLSSERGALMGVLDGLAGGYRVELDEVALENYWLALRHLEIQTIREAIDRVRSQGRKFMPHPGELRAVAESLLRDYYEPETWRPSEDPERARLRARADFDALTPASVADNYIAEAEKAASRASNARAVMARHDKEDPMYKQSEVEWRKSKAEQEGFRDHARWWRAQGPVVDARLPREPGEEG